MIFKIISSLAAALMAVCDMGAHDCRQQGQDRRCNVLGGTTCRLAAIHRLVCRNACFMVVVTVLWTAWHGCSHRKLAAAADGRGSVYCCWPPVLLAASFCILTGKGMHACLRLALVGSVGLVYNVLSSFPTHHNRCGGHGYPC